MLITNFPSKSVCVCVCVCVCVDCVGLSDVFLYSEKCGTVVQISNVTSVWKNSDF